MVKKKVKSAFSAAQTKELLFLLNHEGLHSQQGQKQLWGAVAELRTLLNDVCRKIAKPVPGLDWRAELEKLMPLAKALNENPRVIYDDGAHRSTEVRPEKPFCVIANTARYAHGGAQGRTWCTTQKIAEGYAESLMRNHPGMYDEMFVVEVVSKVAKKSPELEVTRY